jgi:phosphosulfolactate phosphohydrolase-like enzyme
MKFLRLPLAECGQADDIVVAIDVIRAFTCAAFASDLEFCLAADRFDFAMQVEWRAGLNILRPVHD